MNRRKDPAMENVPFTVRIFREDQTFVAHAPELDVSTCGESEAAARANIQDAVRGYLETASEQGTLDEILEECGYRREAGGWKEPEVVAEEHMSVGFG
jgi:predicted RNase H-like HicB family nuclease